MPKILITGKNSFVGTSFRKYSSFRDIEEISLIDIHPDKIDFTCFDVVLHLSAIVPQSKKKRGKDYFHINRDLALDVAKQAKNSGIRHFVFMSTIKVFGKFKAGSRPWDEFSECMPSDDYGRSKYEAELALMNLNDGKFMVSIIRSPLIYGEGVKANMLKIIRIVQLLPILPFDGIENRRNYTYIENLVGFIDRIIELKVSGIFIAMDNGSMSTTTLIKLIYVFSGKIPRLFRLPEPFIKTAAFFFPEIINRLYGSFELENSWTRKTLNFDPKISSSEGIKRMMEAFTPHQK